MILDQLEKIAEDLANSDDLVAREAGIRIKSIIKYLRWYHEPSYR